MLDIRYLPGIHIFIFALTLYYSYFIISMSLYLPFIPEHLISTYPINILTHSYKNKQTYYSHIYLHTILFYHYFIPSSFHPYPIFYSIHLLSYLSIPILYSLPTHLSLTILPYSILNLLYHHSTTTQYIILYLPR